MLELDCLIERLKQAYTAADHTTPGGFRFVSDVGTTSGGTVCVIVLARDAFEARLAAAKALAQ